MTRYEPKEIEAKWQGVWEEAQAFHVDNPAPGAATHGRKQYVLEMLPYPSGTLHMGHVLVYTLGDVLAHYYRRNGLHVLRPMGFDSFGLPAENAAIKSGTHPRETVERNIESIVNSMKKIGWAIDWQRVFSTHEPSYYKWTQWLFLAMFDAGLAYRKAAPVKWCPFDQTVLANEQVKDGRCERCGTLVVSKNLEQWFFETTLYADELLRDLDTLDWPERVKAMQRHWIGRSEGAEIIFRIEELDIDVPVFTTRPDTLFGATFFVLAPEHPLVVQIATEEVRAYVSHAAAKRTEERAAAVEKTGVFTGYYAINPVNGERLPIWVADYVLMDYGTGAIMAVPAHDERDREFAEKFELPIREVIDEEGVLFNSGSFTGRPAEDAKREIVEWLGEQGKGRPAVSFRLRDWGFSRQRYWGAPIPIIYCDNCGVVQVPRVDLPVLLPDIADYTPKGKPPLAQAEDWVNVTCPQCGGPGKRETETMDTFVDSSWYFLRYCDPNNDRAPFDRAIVDFWGPVDHYTGGIDHSTVHMIYARFFQKALNDLDLAGFREPFARFFVNGWVTSGGMKMGKRAGNVTGPDAMVERYGADAIRAYILFLGPADQDMEWTEEGVEGMVRFMRRLWRLVHEVVETAPASGPGDTALARKAHATIARASDDIGRRAQFHTPIAAVMELANDLSKDSSAPDARFAVETAISLIQPYAPHLAEELWQVLGHERLWEQPWPVADQALLERDTFELVVQVNGKVRDRFEVETGLPESELVERALQSDKVRAHMDGKQVRQTIVVPNKLVNLVLG